MSPKTRDSWDRSVSCMFALRRMFGAAARPAALELCTVWQRPFTPPSALWATTQGEMLLNTEVEDHADNFREISFNPDHQFLPRVRTALQTVRHVGLGFLHCAALFCTILLSPACSALHQLTKTSRAGPPLWRAGSGIRHWSAELNCRS